MQGKKYEKPCSYLFKEAYGQNSRDQQFEKIKDQAKQSFCLPIHLMMIEICII